MRVLRLNRVSDRSYIAFVSDEDYERVNARRWIPVRHKHTYYASTGSRVLLHWFITGTKGIDHIDGNGLNNTRENLRKCTQSQNMLNTKRHRDGTAGIFKRTRNGLTHYQVTHMGEYVGCFRTLEKAKAAKNSAMANVFKTL